MGVGDFTTVNTLRSSKLYELKPHLRFNGQYFFNLPVSFAALALESEGDENWNKCNTHKSNLVTLLEVADTVGLLFD